MTPEELQVQIMNAIAAYNQHRAQILQDALNHGGAPLVEQLEGEYEALRDAYFELIRRQLDRNNHRYDQLTQEAASTASAIEQSVTSLANTTQILNTIAGAVNLIGRILIVLGI